MPKIRIGTRGSPLAMAQAGYVAETLTRSLPEVRAKLVPIETSGDRQQAVGDKSRFVKEIEQALLDNEVDLAVHSAKDLPGQQADGLTIVAVPQRLDARDVYVGPAKSIDEIPQGGRVGTSSLRRRSQLLSIRPDLRVEELKGNVDTRLSKIADDELDGIVLAAAGLQRLGRGGEGAFTFSVDRLVPAPGQGALALQARLDNAEMHEIVHVLNDRETLTCFTAERALVNELDASCHTPLGAYAWPASEALHLAAFVGLPDGTRWLRDQVEGDPNTAAELGRLCAARMRAAGAGEILAAGVAS